MKATPALRNSLLAALLLLGVAIYGLHAIGVAEAAGALPVPAWVSVLLVVATAAAWWLLGNLSAIRGVKLTNWLVPAIFGGALLLGWEIVCRGYGVPRVLLPAPSQIWDAFFRELPTLIDDFRQTFLKAVIAGFTIGNLLGLATALIVDRVPFLQRGLLPLGNMVSAVPIIGIAPIMVMWFGFGWESKTAVIVFMIFFPMLVNALAGLNAADNMSRDLMRSYAAGYWATLCKLRLPAALPFIFNALKINSTLALIGAIVAEFFGSPISGMGFRISVEVARMNVDVVWATIAVAALAGSISYGVLALLERHFTSWHASFRGR
ncbi:ABC transporter permease [Dongia rigui]|uniref:ABC transporter permease n=1 Tax=Dongia rigui TaxID=940149 RepID=A0ABU5E4W9_9PROT|nr:ABC transporter permease [Dongia rigui]MDY0873978.1 ABC transporter permease [Dongia rigui]